jgi:hypothetical protein
MTNFYFQLFIPSDSSTTDQGIERIENKWVKNTRKLFKVEI